MNMLRGSNRPLALAALALLAACGNQGPGVIGQAVQQVVASRLPGAEPAAAPAAPRSDAERAAEALQVNPGPLIQVGFQELQQTQIMAMTGQNGAMRTYMNPAEEAVILRGGMIIGTRGILGQDLAVAEPGTEGLIRAGASGTGTRVMRYLGGDGLERPLRFSCTVAPAAQGLVQESCEGHGTSFQNTYAVQGGQISVSRQWVGPGIGYVTIATLRP